MSRTIFLLLLFSVPFSLGEEEEEEKDEGPTEQSGGTAAFCGVINKVSEIQGEVMKAKDRFDAVMRMDIEAIKKPWSEDKQEQKPQEQQDHGYKAVEHYNPYAVGGGGMGSISVSPDFVRDTTETFRDLVEGPKKKKIVSEEKIVDTGKELAEEASGHLMDRVKGVAGKLANDISLDKLNFKTMQNQLARSVQGVSGKVFSKIKKEVSKGLSAFKDIKKFKNQVTGVADSMFSKVQNLGGTLGSFQSLSSGLTQNIGGKLQNIDGGLTQNIGGKLKDVTDGLTKSFNPANLLSGGSVSGLKDNLLNGAKNLMPNFGNGLGDAVNKFTKSLTSANVLGLEGLDKLSGGATGVVSQVKGFGGKLGKYSSAFTSGISGIKGGVTSSISKIANNIPGLNSYTEGLGKVLGGIGGAKGAFDTFREGVTGALSNIPGLSDISKYAKSAQGLMSNIPGAGDAFEKVKQGFLSSGGPGLGGLSALGGIGDKLKGGLGGIGDKLKGGVTDFVNGIKGNGVGGITDKIKGAAGNLLGGAGIPGLSDMGNLAQNAKGLLSGGGGALLDKAKQGLLSGGLGGLSLSNIPGVGGIGDKIKGGLSGALGGIGGDAMSAVNGMLGNFGLGSLNIGNFGLGGSIGDIKDNIMNPGNIVKGVQNKVKSIKDGILGKIKNGMQGFVGGMQNVKDHLKGALDKVKNMFGQKSGKNGGGMKGLVNGITDKLKGLTGGGGKKGGGLLDTLKNGASSLFGNVGKIGNKLQGGANGIFGQGLLGSLGGGGIQDKINGLFGAVGGKVGEAQSGLNGLVGGAINGIKSKLGNVMGSLNSIIPPGLGDVSKLVGNIDLESLKNQFKGMTGGKGFKGLSFKSVTSGVKDMMKNFDIKKLGESDLLKGAFGKLKDSLLGGKAGGFLDKLGPLSTISKQFDVSGFMGGFIQGGKNDSFGSKLKKTFGVDNLKNTFGNLKDKALNMNFGSILDMAKNFGGDGLNKLTDNFNLKKFANFDLNKLVGGLKLGGLEKALNFGGMTDMLGDLNPLKNGLKNLKLKDFSISNMKKAFTDFKKNGKDKIKDGLFKVQKQIGSFAKKAIMGFADRLGFGESSNSRSLEDQVGGIFAKHFNGSKLTKHWEGFEKDLLHPDKLGKRFINMAEGLVNPAQLKDDLVNVAQSYLTPENVMKVLGVDKLAKRVTTFVGEEVERLFDGEKSLGERIEGYVDQAKKFASNVKKTVTDTIGTLKNATKAGNLFKTLKGFASSAFSKTGAGNLFSSVMDKIKSFRTTFNETEGGFVTKFLAAGTASSNGTKFGGFIGKINEQFTTIKNIFKNSSGFGNTIKNLFVHGVSSLGTMLNGTGPGKIFNQMKELTEKFSKDGFMSSLGDELGKKSEERQKKREERAEKSGKEQAKDAAKDAASKGPQVAMEMFGAAATFCGEVASYYQEKQQRKQILAGLKQITKQIKQLISYFKDATETFMLTAEGVLSTIDGISNRISELRQKKIMEQFRAYERRSKLVLELFTESMEDVTRKPQFYANCHNAVTRPERIITELIELLESPVNYFEIYIEYGKFSDESFQQMMHLTSGNLDSMMGLWRACDKYSYKGSIPRFKDRQMAIHYGKTQDRLYDAIVKANKKREQRYFTPGIVFGHPGYHPLENIRGYSRFLSDAYTLFNHDPVDYSIQPKYIYSVEFGGASIRRGVLEPEFEVAYDTTYVTIVARPLTADKKDSSSIGYLEALLPVVASATAMNNSVETARKEHGHVIKGLKNFKTTTEQNATSPKVAKEIWEWIFKTVKGVCSQNEVWSTNWDLVLGFDYIVRAAYNQIYHEVNEETLVESLKSANNTAEIVKTAFANTDKLEKEKGNKIDQQIKCEFKLHRKPMDVVLDNIQNGMKDKFDKTQKNIDDARYHVGWVCEEKEKYCEKNPENVEDVRIKKCQLLKRGYEEKNTLTEKYKEFQNILDDLKEWNDPLFSDTTKKITEYKQQIGGKLGILVEQYNLMLPYSIFRTKKNEKRDSVDDTVKYLANVNAIMVKRFAPIVARHGYTLDDLKTHTRDTMYLVRSQVNFPEEDIPDKLKKNVLKDMNADKSPWTILHNNRCEDGYRVISVYKVNVHHGYKYTYRGFGNCISTVTSKNGQPVQYIACFRKEFASCQSKNTIISCKMDNGDNADSCDRESIVKQRAKIEKEGKDNVNKDPATVECNKKNNNP